MDWLDGEASVEGQEKAVEASIHLLAERSVIGEDHAMWKNLEKDVPSWVLERRLYLYVCHKRHRHCYLGFVGKYYNVPAYMLMGGLVTIR